MGKAKTKKLEEERKQKIAQTMKKRIASGEIINAFSKGEKHSKANLGIKFSKARNKRISKVTKEAMKRPEVRAKILYYNQSRLGKSYEEIYGKNKAKEIINNMIGKVGWAKGKKRSKKFCKMVSIATKKAMNTPEMKKKMSKISLGRKFSEETKQKLRNMWNIPIYRKQFYKLIVAKPNIAEKKLLKILKPFGMKYVGNGKKWFTWKDNTRFNPDFINLKQRKIIELFGVYWHTSKNNRTRRDKERIATYKRCGYDCLVIWDYELKNPDKIEKKVRRFMKYG